MESTFFIADEREQLLPLCRSLMRYGRDVVTSDDFQRLKALVASAIEADVYRRDRFGLNPVIRNLSACELLCERLSPDRNMVVAMMIYHLYRNEFITRDKIVKEWGADVAKMVDGLNKVSTLYSRHNLVGSENFRNLLLTFAEDIRVIILMILDRLALMRAINHHPDHRQVCDVAYEVSYLYAPLAHRLGLYSIKSELEDMSLKYTNRDVYTQIAHKLNETKACRDAYIDDFIRPIKEKLEREGLKFEIKGRTKSISSIWSKIKKQKTDLDKIYDLFAIRIILDVPLEREKNECWLAYSIVTDMYRPNPSRLKDWLSIPKSNGYESLHITVYGPENKWVEVQIRTKRMDAIAEKGLAAHWKYKGIKSEGNLDAWMNNVRDILEAAESGPMELMKNMRMDVYDKEVFAFTPKGDLYRLPLGATLLDFAFSIHTNVGSQCTGGRVNGKNQKINYKLQSGDTVEIFTSAQQVPKQDWLNYVVTSKARNKIRVALKEQESRVAELGKELLQRRFKNRKIEIDEAILSKVIKKLGSKTVTEFYTRISEQSLDVNAVVEAYLAQVRGSSEESEKVSASEYIMQPLGADDDNHQSNDVLVIGNNIKGINYKLAKCCNPIYGDDVFGFISSEGVIKIHRTDCPNAANIREKYPYRLIRTQWSGKLGSQFGATLRIVGIDDIGIVTNITSIINKEKNVTLRSITVDSNDGLFQGYVIVGINDTTSLNQLIKKIQTVKGVKNVERSK
ncbi:MAG: RelA/SpoT family protein [Muribaculaceae bacterium]|nr:RelA/SpoT family protein [Muribaculaceae bacterium]